MIDINGIEVKLTDIIKYEDFELGEVKYYIVAKGEFNYMWLFLLDDKGNMSNNKFFNIKIDNGISLLNNETKRWTIIGTKDKIYDKLFKINSNIKL